MHNELINDAWKISNFKSKGRFKHHRSFLGDKIANSHNEIRRKKI
jgi:hypothetical protein